MVCECVHVSMWAAQALAKGFGNRGCRWSRIQAHLGDGRGQVRCRHANRSSHLGDLVSGIPLLFSR